MQWGDGRHNTIPIGEGCHVGAVPFRGYGVTEMVFPDVCGDFRVVSLLTVLLVDLGVQTVEID
eukprot:scaffold10178_cov23-Cyclotella_meneghiniana.AAC.5